ncbi:hypothetical protein [Streptomyces sp. NBC_01320]|uniref:hypothetical protein n=1 Tax=Streptomyces sp. NBC_01320 TaxID=2903824 RepID=UPI003FA39E90
MQVPARARHIADGRVLIEQGAGLPVRQPDEAVSGSYLAGLRLRASMIWTDDLLPTTS